MKPTLYLQKKRPLLALRTQQVIAHETGVPEVVDPFAGSYFVERLTLDLEKKFFAELETIEAMGGMVGAVEESYPASRDRPLELRVPASS